jgi:hypothetical protein
MEDARNRLLFNNTVSVLQAECYSIGAGTVWAANEWHTAYTPAPLPRCSLHHWINNTMKQCVTRLAQALPGRPMSDILPIRLPPSLDAASITESNDWATPVSELGKTLEVASRA